jgi:hypothetical protein
MISVYGNLPFADTPAAFGGKTGFADETNEGTAVVSLFASGLPGLSHSLPIRQILFVDREIIAIRISKRDSRVVRCRLDCVRIERAHRHSIRRIRVDLEVGEYNVVPTQGRR